MGGANAGLANFNIFISKHKMPREFAYRAESEMWVAEEEDGAQVIARDCVVRFRVHNLIFPSKKEMVSDSHVYQQHYPPPSPCVPLTQSPCLRVLFAAASRAWERLMATTSESWKTAARTLRSKEH